MMDVLIRLVIVAIFAAVLWMLYATFHDVGVFWVAAATAGLAAGAADEMTRGEVAA